MFIRLLRAVELTGKVFSTFLQRYVRVHKHSFTDKIAEYDKIIYSINEHYEQ